jgi:hypothetical protein
MNLPAGAGKGDLKRQALLIHLRAPRFFSCPILPWLSTTTTPPLVAAAAAAAVEKAEAVEILKKEVGYKPYPYKHYESVFTRFYQGHILPEKFNIDKRKMHLSALILSAEITRDEALEYFKTSPYPDQALLKQDKEYVIKKFGMAIDEFDAYLKTKSVAHSEYPSEEKLFKMFLKINRFLKRFRP